VVKIAGWGRIIAAFAFRFAGFKYTNRYFSTIPKSGVTQALPKFCPKLKS
jgi:hypothetical protein